MKSKTLAVLIVAAFVAVTGLYAQSSTRLMGNIPFQFSVGNSVLPAGEYEVAPTLAPRALVIRATDGKAAVIALPLAAEKVQAPKDSVLVFNRYGNTYFLSQVWHAGITRGYALPKSKSEREMARRIPGTEYAAITVVAR